MSRNISNRQKLFDWIKSKGQVRINELYDFADSIPAKHETLSRELRPSKNQGLIEEIKEHGTITGYRWKQENPWLKDWK